MQVHVEQIVRLELELVELEEDAELCTQRNAHICVTSYASVDWVTAG